MRASSFFVSPTFLPFAISLAFSSIPQYIIFITLSPTLLSNGHSAQRFFFHCCRMQNENRADKRGLFIFIRASRPSSRLRCGPGLATQAGHLISQELCKRLPLGKSLLLQSPACSRIQAQRHMCLLRHLHTRGERERHVFHQLTDDKLLGSRNHLAGHPVAHRCLRHKTLPCKPSVAVVVGLKPQLHIQLQLVLILRLHVAQYSINATLLQADIRFISYFLINNQFFVDRISLMLYF